MVSGTSCTNDNQLPDSTQQDTLVLTLIGALAGIEKRAATLMNVIFLLF
jgi:hypothetical protein